MDTPPKVTARPIHTLRIAVRWGDMDALGHVNNAAYLSYFEQSRIEWLESLGVRLTGEGAGPILLKATVTYLRPIVYPSEIELRLAGLRAGNTSFAIGGEIVNAHDATQRFTEGEFVLVWTDYASNKPIPVPDFLRAALRLEAA